MEYIDPVPETVPRRSQSVPASEMIRASPFAAVAGASTAVVAWAVAIGCLTTILLAIPESFLPDANLGWVDAWFYVSFTRHLPEKLAQYYFLYHAERLAWTLPGYLASEVVSPLTANYIVKGAFFITSLLALFGTLRSACSVKTCAFVTALAGLYSYFVHAIGAQYADGAANAWFLLTLNSATHAARAERSTIRWAFLAGVCYLAVLQAHLVFLLIAPWFVAYVIATRLRSGRRDIEGFGAMAIGFVAGLVIAYSCVDALYMLWGVPHRPLFTSMQVLYVHRENTLVWPTTLKWILVSYWLVLPTTVVAWIAIDYARALRSGGWRGVVRLPDYYWFLLAMYGFWVAAYFARAPVIIVPFYVSYLIPLTFLALGPLIAPMVEQLSAKSYAYLLGSVFVVTATAYRASDPRYAGAVVMAAIGCLAAATAIGFAAWGPERRRPTAFITLLVVALCGIDFAAANYSTQLRNAYKYTEMAQYYREPRRDSLWTASRAAAFEGAIDAAERLRPRLTGQWYYVWYDGEDPMGMFFRSLGSFFFAWQTNGVLNERFHGIDAKAVNALLSPPGQPTRGLLIFTRDADVSSSDHRLRHQWTEAFRTAGTPYYAHYFVVDQALIAGGPHRR
jgi:hypothetical protein